MTKNRKVYRVSEATAFVDVAKRKMIGKDVPWTDDNVHVPDLYVQEINLGPRQRRTRLDFDTLEDASDHIRRHRQRAYDEALAVAAHRQEQLTAPIDVE